MSAQGGVEPRGGPLRVLVLGAGGRMGRRMAAAVDEAPDLVLAARIDPAFTPGDAPADAAGAKGAVASSASALPAGSCDVAVEFTHGDALPGIQPEILRLGCAWISGTTGLTAESRAALEAAARSVPVLWSPNMSLGIALLRQLCRTSARLLPPDWVMELVETHHSAKLDAPSGTALALAETWTRARGGGDLRFGRSGRSAPRSSGEVGLHAVRLPDVVGEHRILLGGPAETVELAHRALDRAAFVGGTLAAVRWLAEKPAGFYTLDDLVEDRLR